jgi:protein-S-isoprenylcysteine O-methyltransferase Ste14
LPAASRGSWLAILIAGVPMILLCRALLEDKMLREELAGYKEYAAQVNRLALGIW